MEKVIELELNESEQKDFDHSVEMVKKDIASLDNL